MWQNRREEEWKWERREKERDGEEGEETGRRRRWEGKRKERKGEGSANPLGKNKITTTVWCSIDPCTSTLPLIGSMALG